MAQTDKSLALQAYFQGADTALFASGKLAIIQSGSLTAFNANEAIQDPKVAVVRSALFPKRTDGQRPSQMRGGTWNIGSQSKNPDAAWKFIQILDNHDGTLSFNTIGGNGALVRPDIMNQLLQPARLQALPGEPAHRHARHHPRQRRGTSSRGPWPRPGPRPISARPVSRTA